MLKKFYCLVFVLLPLLCVQGQSVNSKYNSLLWEISKPGQKTSYLYGTMHVSRKLAFNLSDTFYIALKNTDVVALELDPETWMQEMSKAGDFLDKDPRYKSNTQNVYSSFELMEIEQEAYEYVLSKGHNFANALLYRNSDESDFEENTYLDMFIYQAAQKWGKRLVGLEDYQFVESCQYYGEQSKPGSKSRGGMYNTRLEIEKAYRKGDLSALDSINTLLFDGTYYREYMLDKRNVIMANHMDSIMKSGYSLFTGVGAAHLPGEMGVIELLKKQGYNVRPINSKSTEFSTQQREQLEKTFIPIPYQTVQSPDSLFEIMLPKQLYVISNKRNVTEYFYPEMKNGTYYSITKINTYSNLFSKTIEEQTKIFEDILYEHVPGKILKKQIDKQSDKTIITIMNETRKGDIQRYKIFILSNEVIIGKMAGTGEFAKGKDGELFVQKFQLLNRQTNTTVKLPQLSIDMGSGRVSETFSLTPLTFQSTSKLDVIQNDTYNFLLSTTYFDYNYIEEDTFELDYIISRFATSIEAEVLSKTFYTVHQRPSLSAQLKGKKDLSLTIQVYIEGPRYYLLGSTKASKEEINRRMQTLQINYPKIEHSVVLSDTAMFFTTKSTEEIAKINGQKFTIEPDINKSTTQEYSGNIVESIYHSDVYGLEKVEVFYKQYNPYMSFKDIDKYWEDAVKRIEKNQLVVYSKEINNDVKYPTMLVEIRDTNSIRNIYWKYIMVDASIYCLSYSSDTLLGLTSFAKTYFDNFSPTKSLSTRNLFTPQLGQFYHDLLKGDSLQAIGAYKSIDGISFKVKDLDSLKFLISQEANYPSYLKKYKVKYELIEAVGTIKGDESIAYLKELYLTNSDSMIMQSKILGTLARNKSQASYKVLKQLLFQEQPYLEYNDISSIFRNFYDSLELSAQMFPELLDLTRYSSYRTHIYKLMAVLWEKQLIKKSVLAKHKSFLILDANEEVKGKLTSNRYNSSSTAYYDYNYKSTTSTYDNVEVYMILLSPYQKDAEVKTVYDRISRIKDPMTQMRYNIMRIKLNMPVQDSIYRYYASQTAYRASFYRGLTYVGKANKFDTTYLRVDSMAKALLYNGLVKTLQNDSIVFLDKKYAELRGSKKGYVYFYKRYNKDNRKWYLDYIGLMPEAGQPIDMFPMSTSKYTVLKNNTDKEVNKKVETTMNEFKMYKRDRARSRYSYYNDYDDYEF
ncbi:MAG: TraB/GumN family protein [Cytophagaceae bacterium]